MMAILIALKKTPPPVVVWSLSLASLGLLLFSSYSGPHNFLYNFTHQWLINPDLYKLDLYLNNSLLLQSSPYFEFLRYFRLDLMNDRTGFALHIFYSLVAAFFVYRILHEYFHRSPAQTVIILMILLIFTSSKLLAQVQPSWLSVRSGTTTQVALTLSFATVYYVLSSRHLVASCCLTAVFVLSIKVGWILLPVSGLTLILHRGLFNRQLAAYFIPFAYLLYKALGSTSGFDAEASRLMTEAVFLRGQEEDVFHLQGIFPLTIFALSTPVFFFLANSLGKGIERDFSMACLIVTLMIVLLGGWYGWHGYTYFPNPGLALLSPVRATYLYQFLFVLMAALWIIDSDRLYGLEKLFLLSILVIFKVGAGTGTYLNLVLILVCTGLLVSAICRFKCPAAARFLCNTNYLWFLLPMLLIYSTATVLKKEFNREGYDLLGSWTIPHYTDRDLWKLALELRSIDEDRVILIILEQDRCTTRTCGRPDKMLGLSPDYESFSKYTIAVMPNVLARKSPYAGDFTHLLLNYPAYREHKRRVGLVESVLMSLGNTQGDLDIELRHKLWRENIHLLVPDEVSGYFPEWNVEKRQGRLVYMAPRPEFR